MPENDNIQNNGATEVAPWEMDYGVKEEESSEVAPWEMNYDFEEEEVKKKETGELDGIS
jgi:hypothetical protein